jgi:hypothetical protein
MPTPKTIVVFRKWRKRIGAFSGNEILALFPEEADDNAGRYCNSYEHVGQHGGADYTGCISATVPARPSEYKDLARELRRIGYRLDIRTRATVAMHRKRRAT